MKTELIGLIDDALQQPEEEREAWIDRVCGAGTPLAAELREMLASEAHSSGLLERPLHAVADGLGLSVAAGRPGETIGRLIGPYRLIALIGSGGMGEVYRAERESGFAQTVALKLIRDEKLTDQTRARFLLERQILAQLVHPNIAHLIDGGVTENFQPWFALEYIEGDSLLAWCDTRRVSLEQRLRLMLEVCAAVGFAHSHLIVHRDIKPGNVLVDTDGRVKLLDFGIAKLLGDEGALQAFATMTQVRALTPEYAAPEQVRGETVTTATDIHALGLLLYELLCGQRAFGREGTSSYEVQREVTDRIPAPMTQRLAQPEAKTGSRAIAAARRLDANALCKSLRGDLQYIVDKALRKEPEQRYRSVVEMADDIRRHLDNRPVLAADGARGYRFGKFVRRNRLGVAFAALAILAVLFGTAGIAWQAHRASTNARVAIQEAERNHMTLDFLVSLLGSAAPNNQPLTVGDLLKHAQEQALNTTKGSPEQYALLMEAIYTIYEQRHDGKGIKELLLPLLNRNPQTLPPKVVATAACRLGLAEHLENNNEEAKHWITLGQTQAQALSESARDARATCYYASSFLSIDEGDMQQTLESSRRAVMEADPDFTRNDSMAVGLHNFYGDMLLTFNSVREARDQYQGVLEAMKLAGRGTSVDAAQALTNIARSDILMGLLTQGVKEHEDGIAAQLEATGPSASIANEMYKHAGYLIDAGRPQEALAYRDKAAAMIDQYAPDRKANSAVTSLLSLARVDAALGDLVKGKSEFDATETLLNDTNVPPKSALRAFWIFYQAEAFAPIHEDKDRALATLAIFDALEKRHNEAAFPEFLFPRLLHNQAEMALLAGDLELAETKAKHARDVLMGFSAADGWLVADCDAVLAQIQISRGDNAARKLLESAAARLERSLGPAHPRTLRLRNRLTAKSENHAQ